MSDEKGGNVMIYSLLFCLLPSFVLALDLDSAVHLLRRTEFAPTIERLDAVLSQSQEEAVKELLHRKAPLYYKGSDYSQFIQLTLNYEKGIKNLLVQWQAKKLSERDFKQEHKRQVKKYLSSVMEVFSSPSMSHNREKDKELKKKKQRIFEEISKYRIQKAFQLTSRHFLKLRTLQYWWVQEMLKGQDPFREMMTLFWHDHFATSFQKIKDVPLLAVQNHTLRKNALKPFGTLLEEMSEDQALLRYLDAQLNHKNKANENFARELMELFTLGIGHYTEEDVSSASRALTGFMPLFGKGSRLFVFNPKAYDPTEKLFLNQRGNFNKKDIIQILLQQEQTARHIVHKLWLYFISPTPDEALVKKWGADFYKSNYNTSLLLETMFNSQVFYESKGQLFKSPIDYMVGSARIFGLDITERELPAINKMGMALFVPPDVAGWRGGTQWITTATFPKREKSLKKLLSKNTNKELWLEWVKNKRQPKQVLDTIFLAVPLLEQSPKTPVRNNMVLNYAFKTNLDNIQEDHLKKRTERLTRSSYYHLK